MPTPPDSSSPCRGAIVAAFSAALLACAPAHDWREARSADGVVRVLFPCKPQLHERRVALAGGEVRLSLQACEAGGQTWGLASAELDDPNRLGPALDALAMAAGANAGAAARREALQVPGAMAHPGNRRLALEGRRPDGQPLQMRLALFAQGTRVYQATVLGDRVPAEAADSFFESLRVTP